MAFKGDNMTPVGGNSRSGITFSTPQVPDGKNAPMAWAYQTDDELADLLSPGYFDTFNPFLAADQFILVSTDAGNEKFIITVLAVDRFLKMVEIDTEVFRPLPPAPTITKPELYTINFPYENALSNRNQGNLMVGEFDLHLAALSSSDPTFNKHYNGQRFMYRCQSFTANTIITLKGTTIDAVTGIPDNNPLTALDTVFVTSTGDFVSGKNFTEIREVIFTPEAQVAGQALGVKTFANKGQKFSIGGYQGKFWPSGNLDMRLEIVKLKHIFEDKFQEVPLEDISFLNRNANQSNRSTIIDHLRFPFAVNRSIAYLTLNAFADGITYDWTQDDFDSFFSISQDNIIDPALGEGLFIKVNASDQVSNAANLDSISLTMYLQELT